MTHYDVLGVDPEAPVAEIRRSYVRLARLHHPDYFVAADAGTRLDAERRMQAINEAWSVLSDAGRRRAYDRASGQHRPGDPADDGFRPFDTADDDPDPRDLPDQPYRHDPAQGSLLNRAITLAPVVAFLVSVGLLAVSMVLRAPALLALSVASFLLACVGFVVIPLLALSRASRDD